MRYVVDTSVVVKWLLPEVDSSLAERVRDSEELFAPDCLEVEVAAALWTRVRFSSLPVDRALGLFEVFRTAPLVLEPSSALVTQALGIAARTGTTAYDAIYLALALRDGLPLLTASARFATAANAH